MVHPILSICIPTFNRSRYLKDCLKSILQSAQQQEDKIEIIISDNASTDDTKEILSEFQKQYSFIRFYRNEINVFDKNFFIAASYANGEYIWIFGDDDQVENEAIKEVLEKIREGYNLIVLNHSIWLNNFSWEFRKKALPFAEDTIFHDHNKLLSVLGPRLGFISSVVIKKETFIKVPFLEYEPFIEFGFSFLLSIYMAVFQDCHAYFIAKPLVRQTGNLKGSHLRSWYKNFVQGSSLAFEKLRCQGYSFRAVYSAKHLILKDYIMHDISFRKRKGESLKGIFRFIIPYYKSHWFFWIFIVPALFAPNILAKSSTSIAIKYFRKLFKF